MPTYEETLSAIKANRAEQQRRVQELLRANPKLPLVCAQLAAIAGPRDVEEALAALRSKQRR